MKKKLSIIILFLCSFSVISQTRSCGTMDYLEVLKFQDPMLEQVMQNNNSLQQRIDNHTENFSSTILTIPVVVHVIYQNSSQNISNAQILSQINILNEDFRKNNSDATSIPSAFVGVAADSEIEFCLAVRDPNGNVTTGITRTSTTNSSFSGYTSMKYSSSGGQDAWNTSNYLNIWVCNLSSGLLGFATFPGGNSSTDGVVCDYAYFGNTGTATYPYHLGRTATHEVGHWLNLYHIWGDSYCGNDYVSDTPKHEESNYGCPSFPHASSCSGTGSNGEMFMNYMDYTNDACMYMFSTGQKNRMRATLTGTRSSLLSSNGCTAVFTPFALSAIVKNVSCNSANIGVSNDGNINLSLTGGTAPYTYNWSNGATTQDISNLTAGSYSVSVTDAVGQVENAYYIVSAPSAISVTYTVTSTSAPGVSDGAVNVNVSGGTTPLSYYWDDSASGYSAITQDLSNVLAGTYAYYVIDDNGCYELYSIVVPEGQLLPIVVTDNVSNISCYGNNDGAIDLTIIGGATPYSFIWSNGATIEDLSGLSSGTYSVIITDAQSQTFTSSYTISEPSQLTATYSVNNVTTAGGNDGAINLSPTGGVYPYNFYWSTGHNTEDLSNLIAGNYNVYIVDANMCYTNIMIDVSEVIYGCTDPNSCNYDQLANTDDGSCYGAMGCTDASACNYDVAVCIDDGSCEYTSCSTCSGDPITGLFVSGIIDNRAVANFDNMNTYDASGDQICRVDQIRIRYRELGTSSWSQKNIASPTGYNATTGICNSTQKTDKNIYGLTMGTTYEWQVKLWYCSTGATTWAVGPNFTTLDECPNIGNFTAYGANATKATFDWDDSNGEYEFVRIKMRVDTNNAVWFNVGGSGVTYGTYTKNKNNLSPGTTYRAQSRTWCDPNGGAYKSPQWTSLLFWTQPTNVRLEGGSTIANLAIYPNPSRDVFNISFTSEEIQNLKVRIINVVGEELVSDNLEQFIGEYTKAIDLANYTKGVYFLEITTNNGVVNKKLILQ